jgi:CheY-like chemotaxis protein
MGTASGEVPRREQGHDRASILVVEDEILVRWALAEDLRSAGVDVIECATADEAITVLRSGASVDVIISDVRMPGSMDGIELAGLVRNEYPSIKVFLVSGHLSSLDGVVHDGFFQKPYQAHQIIAAIKDVLD